jgi:hypothetical protein
VDYILKLDSPKLNKAGANGTGRPLMGTGNFLYWNVGIEAT